MIISFVLFDFFLMLYNVEKRGAEGTGVGGDRWRCSIYVTRTFNFCFVSLLFLDCYVFFFCFNSKDLVRFVILLSKSFDQI